MFNMKIAATVFITLAILVVFLFTSPQVGGFFQSVKDRTADFLSPAENIERNISFSLSLNEYGDINATAKNVNMFLKADKFSASIKDGTLEAKGNVNILGYIGFVSARKNGIVLDGNFKKIELDDAALSFVQGPIKSSVVFERLAIDNLTLKELSSASGGLLNVSGTETKFAGKITVKSPQGSFSFDDGLFINGRAAKISIPEAKISIG